MRSILYRACLCLLPALLTACGDVATKSESPDSARAVADASLTDGDAPDTRLGVQDASAVGDASPAATRDAGGDSAGLDQGSAEDARIHMDSGTVNDSGPSRDTGEALDVRSSEDVRTPARCGDGRRDASEECDDGNRDNTDDCLNTCVVARCGDSIVHAGEEACDDGNRDDTDDCLNTCVAARCGDGILRDEIEACDEGDENGEGICSQWCTNRYLCDPLPAMCPDAEDWGPGGDAHELVAIEGCTFALDAPSDEAWQEGEALAQRLLDDHNGARTMAQVLNDTNRTMQNDVTLRTSHRMRNHEMVGHMWNDGDNGVPYWMPQGITGSHDGGDVLRVGRRTIIVSWYHKTDARPTKGARLSIVDMSANPPRYRLALLVVPYLSAAGIADFGPAEYDGVEPDALHAGGIVWYGPYLYVADTREGMRVFDLRRVLRIDDVEDNDRIGVYDGVTHAAGYRYAIPQVARYRRALNPVDNTHASCPVKFSSIGLDRTRLPHTILSAEYFSDERYGRLVNWQLDPITHRLDARAGLAEGRRMVRGREAFVSGETKMQGALSAHGIYYISSSSQTATRYGRLYRNRLGQGESEITAWPYGCEDLYYEGDRNLIWTATEFAGSRELVGIPRQNSP